MVIDNFDTFRPHLTFEKARKFDPHTGNVETINDTYDRYVVQILQRAKDQGGRRILANTSARLLKTYEVSSLEYFDMKRAHIVDLCRSNRARAYILPQVRSTYDCIKEMIKLGVDNLENPTVKFQHVLRSCLCSVHKSRDKKWILDLDRDCMAEERQEGTKTWTVDGVLSLVRDELAACGKRPEDAFVVPTKSGHHIVTRPFNLQSAYGKCGMMFEGEKGGKVGWLHKDGMSLLYFSDEG